MLGDSAFLSSTGFFLNQLFKISGIPPTSLTGSTFVELEWCLNSLKRLGIPVLRVTWPYLNLPVKHSFFSRFSGKHILLCI